MPGVYGMPRCPGVNSSACEIMRKVRRLPPTRALTLPRVPPCGTAQMLALGAYVDAVQSHLVQAQYWQDPFHEGLAGGEETVWTRWESVAHSFSASLRPPHVLLADEYEAKSQF